MIDWVLCVVIARGFFGPHAVVFKGQLIIVAILVVENVLLVAAAGATLGQRLLGVQVERLDGGRVGFTWVVIRALLIGLGFPPLTLIWEQDRRGLQDLASGSVVARR
jgi:uncharacterized RDD family membrane protein YckC